MKGLKRGEKLIFLEKNFGGARTPPGVCQHIHGVKYIPREKNQFKTRTPLFWDDHLYFPARQKNFGAERIKIIEDPPLPLGLLWCFPGKEGQCFFFGEMLKKKKELSKPPFPPKRGESFSWIPLQTPIIWGYLIVGFSILNPNVFQNTSSKSKKF